MNYVGTVRQPSRSPQPAGLAGTYGWQAGLDGLTRALWIVPRVPPSMNQWERSHWGNRNYEKKVWAQYCHALALRAGLPRPSQWVFASAEIIFRKSAHRDGSNYEATLWKIFPDVLQRIGVLKDDTDKEMRRGKVILRVDKTLLGLSRDPRQAGLTRLALIAKE